MKLPDDFNVLNNPLDLALGNHYCSIMYLISRIELISSATQNLISNLFAMFCMCN